MTINGQTVYSETVPTISTIELKNATSTVVSVGNSPYMVLEDSSDYVDTEKRYTVIVDKMVTDSGKVVFKNSLLAAWRRLHPG